MSCNKIQRSFALSFYSRVAALLVATRHFTVTISDDYVLNPASPARIALPFVYILRLYTSYMSILSTYYVSE